MQSLLDLNLLVDRYAALLPDLDLDGDEQEEYSTMLLRLQNQVETGKPSEWIVNECLEWLMRFTTTKASHPLQGNAA
jgi:hypothetical protein